MTNGKLPTNVKDWLNSGIYVVFGFLMVFGFNKLDKALVDINYLKTEQSLLKYKIGQQGIQIDRLQDRLYRIEQE